MTPCSVIYVTNVEPLASIFEVADVMYTANSSTKQNGVIGVVRKRCCAKETESYQNCMYINQQDEQNSCDLTLLSLDALHVSECISPSSGATFCKLYIAFGTCRYVWHMPDVLTYTKCDVHLIKVCS